MNGEDQVNDAERQQAEREEAYDHDPRVQAKQAFMDEMADFDFGRAMLLMAVQEKVASVGVRNTAIAGLAAAQLEVLNQQAQDIQRRRALNFAAAEVEWQRMETERKAQDEDHDGITVGQGDEDDHDAKRGRRAIPSSTVEPTHPDPTGGQPQSPPPDDPRRNPVPGSKTTAIAEGNARRV